MVVAIACEVQVLRRKCHNLHFYEADLVYSIRSEDMPYNIIRDEQDYDVLVHRPQAAWKQFSFRLSATDRSHATFRPLGLENHYISCMARAH